MQMKFDERMMPGNYLFFPKIDDDRREKMRYKIVETLLTEDDIILTLEHDNSVRMVALSELCDEDNKDCFGHLDYIRRRGI